MTAAAPPPPPGRGRRGNGLSAPSWRPLVDVDPRLTEPLLAALARAGIAAYAEPAPGTRGGYLEVQLPGTPTDRLYTDPRHPDLARTVVADESRGLALLLSDADPDIRRPLEELVRPVGPPARPSAPQRPTGQDDAAWLAIVEGWSREPDSPVPPWPVSEDVDDPGGRGAADDEESSPGRRLLRRAEPPGPAGHGTPGPRSSSGGELVGDGPDDVGDQPGQDDGKDGEDEHFVPPAPPPPPRATRVTKAAWAAIVVGLVLLFAPGLLAQNPSDSVAAVGVLAILGGAGTLVWRMRDASPPDSGPDDGAVV